MKARNRFGWWKMLFGVENEYNTNNLSYGNARIEYLIPFTMIAVSGKFSGIPDGHAVPIRNLIEKSAYDLGRYESLTDQQKVAGFSGYRLPNRMRVYVDMLHPEISTAECTNPKDLLLQQKVSEKIINIARLEATNILLLRLKNRPIAVYKNNSSGFQNENCRWGRSSGQYASWATHENYLVTRGLFNDLMRSTFWKKPGKKLANWMAFLATRIYGGSGKIGSEMDLPECEYQIFQRADFIEKIHGEDTTIMRALVNTRDVPYASPSKYARLHVICGDALIAPWSIYVTYGATALFLKMLVEDFPLPSLSIKDPVAALHLVSRDPTGKERVIELSGEKKKISALEIQKKFLKSMEKYLQETGDKTFGDTVKKLGFILDLFENQPERLKFFLDFAIKKEFLDILREENADERELKLEAAEYHNMDPQSGHYFYLEKNGLPDGEIAGVGSQQGIVTQQEIQAAMANPPTDSRAYFGGEIVRRFPEEIDSLSWNILWLASGDSRAYQKNMRLKLEYDPWFGRKDEIESELNYAKNLSELLIRITKAS